eukprot:scpid30164/ scgid5871/ 
MSAPHTVDDCTTRLRRTTSDGASVCVASLSFTWPEHYSVYCHKQLVRSETNHYHRSETGLCCVEFVAGGRVVRVDAAIAATAVPAAVLVSEGTGHQDFLLSRRSAENAAGQKEEGASSTATFSGTSGDTRIGQHWYQTCKQSTHTRCGDC